MVGLRKIDLAATRQRRAVGDEYAVVIYIKAARAPEDQPAVGDPTLPRVEAFGRRGLIGDAKRPDHQAADVFEGV